MAGRLTTCALRMDSLLVLVSSLLTRLKPAGALQLCGDAPWLAPKAANTISLEAAMVAPVLTLRLATAAVALLPQATWSALRLAPTSAMLYDTLEEAESVK